MFQDGQGVALLGARSPRPSSTAVCTSLPLGGRSGLGTATTSRLVQSLCGHRLQPQGTSVTDTPGGMPARSARYLCPSFGEGGSMGRLPSCHAPMWGPHCDRTGHHRSLPAEPCTTLRNDHCTPRALTGRLPPQETTTTTSLSQDRGSVARSQGWPEVAWRSTHIQLSARDRPTTVWEDGPGLSGPGKPQHNHSPLFLPRLQELLTLFTEFFASFHHCTCALSVPGRYTSLRWIHLALQTAVPSHSTQGFDRQHYGGSQRTAS